MEESAEVTLTSKKARKSRFTSANEEDSVEENSNTNPESVVESSNNAETVVSNGTGDSKGDASEEDCTKDVDLVKITKISKSSKSPLKENLKPASSPNKKTPEKIDSSSASSSSLSDDFLGFEEFTESDEQLINKKTLERLLNKLTDGGEDDEVEVEGKENEEETEAETMTVEDAEPADSDSNQMEIDEGVSHADSVELSDKNDKRTKDSDVEVMETDSLKSEDSKSKKTEEEEEEEKKEEPAAEPETAEPASADQPKVEYCGTCNLVVDDAEEGICCDGKCERWFHLPCSGLSQAEYEELSSDENAKWACNQCSGKPPPVIKPGAKPLLSVRKDLTAVTPSPKRKMPNKEEKRPRVDMSNPIFLKPFDYGWKRELVYRSTNDSASKRQGDVYYYSPKGKKLRSLREIGEHLSGTDLSIDNFTFHKDPIGCDSDKEIIRDAKMKSKDSTASPLAALKKISTPKTPKTPKVAPKLTATVTPLDSASGLPVLTPAKASASVTPRVVLKAGKTGSAGLGPKFKVTPSKTTTPGQATKIVISKDKKKKAESDDDLEMGMLPPTWDPVQKTKENKSPVKRPLEDPEGSPPAKVAKMVVAARGKPELLMSTTCEMYDCLLQTFQYLKVQELLRASRVCKMWRDLALHKNLWETVKMKNSQVKDWDGFSATLRRTGTRHLDLRKMLMPDKPEALRQMWADCIKALSKINTLVKLDLCRCTALWLEQIVAVCPQIEYISAGAIKSNALNFTNLKNCQNLVELRLKSLSGMEANNVDALENLTKLKSLSLTSVKNMTKVLEVLPKLTNLEVLELGEMTNLTTEAVTESFTKLTKLRRLRLEKGGEGCPTDTILETISELPSLVQLELINFDVKAGFEEALGRCTNIKVLLIIPTYVTQSATTNHLVMEGVSKLSKSLVHFVWGLTLELLRVTDLFIDQWEMNKNAGPKSPNQSQPKKASGDSIPILKPSSKEGKKVKEGAVTQVDVLQLPKLHKVLTTLLPNTRIIILKVPFSATWRQTISGSTQ